MKHINHALLSFLFIFSSFLIQAQDMIIEKENGLYITQLTIDNGKGKLASGRFLIDSGSESSTISESLAEELELQAHATETVTDGYQEFEVKETKVNIKFGNSYHKNSKVNIIDLAAFDQVFCEGIKGILGYDIIKNYVWEFTDNNCKVYLSLKSLNKDLHTYSIAKITGKKVPTIYAGFVKDYTSTMLVDWGDNGTLAINKKFINYVDIARDIKLFGGGLQTVKSANNEFRVAMASHDFQIANKPIIEQPTLFVDSDEFAPLDAVGTGLFDHVQAVFDFKRKQFYFLPKTKPSHNLLLDVGFSIKEKNGQYLIAKVIESSTAYLAGLRPNQVITKVNDEAVTDSITCFSVLSEKLLHLYTNGQMINITIKMPDGEQQVSFQNESK